MNPITSAAQSGKHLAMQKLSPWPTAALVFLVGLALSLWVALESRQSSLATAQVQFEHQVDQLQRDIQTQFQRALYPMRGAKGLFYAKGHVTREEFRAFVASRNLASEFPGIRGFGFIEKVARAQLNGFVAAQRLDQAPDFEVSTSGMAAALYVVKFVEPLANNRDALGRDVGADAVMLAAMDKASATGEATLSGAHPLAQDLQKRPGFLYLLPLYRLNMPVATAAERARALQGFLFAPIVLEEVLADNLSVGNQLFDFEIFDGTQPAQHALLFDAERSRAAIAAQPDPEHYRSRRFLAQRPLLIGGHAFTLRSYSSPQLEASLDGSMPVLLGVAGGLLSLTLASTFWLLLSGRRRAQGIAAGMTVELARMAKVATHTSNSVLIADGHCKIVWVNESFTRLTGYTREEAFGQDYAALLHTGGAGPDSARHMTEALKQGQSVLQQVQNRSKSGRTYWAETEGQPLHDTSGEFTGFVAIETDITDRKMAEDKLNVALRDSEALLRTINQYSIVSETDPHGTIMRVNQGFCAISGYSEQEVVGASHAIVSSELHPDEFWADVWRTISSNQPWRGELRNQAKDGTVYWVDTMIAPFANEHGVIQKYVGVQHDITARKKLRQELFEHNQLLQSVLVNIPVGVSVVDRQLNMVATNPLFRQLLDFPDSLFEESGTPFERIIRFNAQRGEYGPGDKEAQIAAIMDRARRTQPHQFERLRPNGVTLEVRGAPMPNGGFVTTYADITELRNATDAAKQASHFKSQFLANTSHDLRTPMNAILGMLKLLQRTELSDRQLDYVGKTEGAAKSLLGLLNDILDVSKVEAGKMTLDPQPFSLDGLLRDLSVLFAASVGSKPVEVLFDVDPAVPKRLLGDAMRLQQVLVNLGGNAIKFTARGDVVLKIDVITLRAQEVVLRFAMRDSGIGIAPEHQQHIFDGFSQAETSTTRRFGGTGLGLSICKSLIALMGGDLKLDSAAGRGSTFHFSLCLPLVEPEQEQPPTPAQAHTAPLAALVVDDNATARQVVATMVRSLGWSVDLADSGEQAIARYQARLDSGALAYQAVLVDVRLPDMEGWQICRRIRQLCVGEPVPIVLMVSANGQEMLLQRSDEEQSVHDVVVVKPVTASMLLDALTDTPSTSTNADNDTNAAPRRAALPPAKGQRLAAMRLLVVDDNVINQQVARELLDAEGALVDVADNGQLGLQAVVAANPRYDAVLMDVRMPVMDGYTATRAIRQIWSSTQLPIIAMTANVMDSDQDACKAAGMNEHIGKPIDVNLLVASLLKLTGRLGNASAAKSTPLASVEWVDVPWVLNRLGGNKTLYLRIVTSFLRESEALLAQLERHLQDGELVQAADLLHTLKGLASTIGAGKLSGLAARWEAEVPKRPAPSALQAAREDIRACLAATGAALQRVVADMRASGVVE